MKDVVTEIDFKYYIDKIDVIAEPNYVPTDEDILHIRQRSTGATDTSFIVSSIPARD